MMIGRDLVRLLQELVHVPEFRAIWKDLMLSPTEFKVPEFRDISQLYRVRTSSRYFLLRITPVMESQLRFLLSDVKFGNHRRYPVWFAKKFLCTAEKETFLIDIVRFICCSHHPPNEIIFLIDFSGPRARGDKSSTTTPTLCWQNYLLQLLNSMTK